MTSRSSLASCASRRPKLPSPWATCSSSSGGRAHVQHREAAARLVRQRAGQPRLAAAGGAGDQQIARMAQPVAAGQRGDEAAVQRAAGAPVDVLDAGRADLELGRLEQPLHAPVVAPGDLALHQQGQPLVEAQTGPRPCSWPAPRWRGPCRPGAGCAGGPGCVRSTWDGSSLVGCGEGCSGSARWPARPVAIALLGAAHATAPVPPAPLSRADGDAAGGQW